MLCSQPPEVAPCRIALLLDGVCRPQLDSQFNGELFINRLQTEVSVEYENGVEFRRFLHPGSIVVAN